jgi:hypothetical protein
LADLQSVMASLGMPPSALPAAAAATGQSASSSTPSTSSSAAATDTAAAATTAGGASGALTAADLQRAMLGIATGGGGGRRGTPLELVLSGEEVLSSGVLEDPAVQARLMPLLPPEQRNVAELRSLVRSPQFQQALGSLANALQTPDNFNSVFANFGLDPAAGAAAMASGDGVGAFIAALEQQARTATTDSEAKADESGDAKMDDAKPDDK